MFKTYIHKAVGAGSIAAALVLFSGADSLRAQESGCSPCKSSGWSAEAKENKDIVSVASAAGSFQTLVAAVKAAGLVETLKGEGPFTVFAPTDEAFAKLPEGTVESLLKPENKARLQAVLTYHVVPGRILAADIVKQKSAATVLGEPLAISVKGEGVMVNNSSVVSADIEAGNGIIHVIDAVLLPPPGSGCPDIVDTAVQAKTFSTLVAAVKAAGLVETLKGEGPFTVFAPTDEAFAKLPKGTVESLLKPENKAQLQAVLKYHVVPGRLPSSEVLKMKTGRTVNGQSVTFSLNKDVAMVNDARIIKTDIEAKNGVIHVIDRVILPN